MKSVLTFDEFVEFTKNDLEYSSMLPNAFDGFINWRADCPDFVYVGFSSIQCPMIPIHKDKIVQITVNNTYKCLGSSASSQMWSATVTLIDETEVRNLLKNLD
jgi:hypothetical protein